MKRFLLAAILVSWSAAAGDGPGAKPVRAVAPGVHLLEGSHVADRRPDGNTIIFAATDRPVVVDTGRHVWHSAAILDFATSQRAPIPVIVNTHWHLDHSSGNERIKAVFPDARLHTTSAIDAALAPDEFLRREYRQLPKGPSLLRLSQVQREEVSLARQAIDHDQFLRPDVTLSASGPMRLAGKAFDVHVTNGAVTDADVWLYDPESRIAALGDLVTLPAPYFESACPKRWREELDAVARVPFELAIPGHGAPMSRAQFEVYRVAYGKFSDCASANEDAGTCAQDWVAGVSTLLDDDSERARARRFAAYYVSFLRDNHGKSPDCKRE